MIARIRQAYHQIITGRPARFFETPRSSAGRQIVCSFGYIQRIGKRGTIDVWLPSELRERIVGCLSTDDESISSALGIEWAAIREFALVQEADYEESFNPERLLYSLTRTIKWRGQDGYRVVVVMLGNYSKQLQDDELRIHDERLQKELTSLINMLYLETESDKASGLSNAHVQSVDWNCASAIPEVVKHLYSLEMTGRGATRSHKCAGIVNNIIKLVDGLPKSHVVHDVAIGIAIPDHEKTNKRQRIVESEKKFSAFKQLLNQFFEPLGHISMNKLQGSSEYVRHYSSNMMRGFGSIRRAKEVINLLPAKHPTVQ